MHSIPRTSTPLSADVQSMGHGGLRRGVDYIDGDNVTPDSVRDEIHPVTMVSKKILRNEILL